MKLLMVMMLLAASTIVLLMGLDLIIGIKLTNIFAKELNPFRVMDATEYILLIVLTLILLIQQYSSFRKNKQKGNSSK